MSRIGYPKDTEELACKIYTKSYATWDLIKRWIEECVTTHQSCARATDTDYLPMRLVDVGTPEIPPRLIESHRTPIRGPYVTLSYCWGGKSGVKLTMSTLESFTTALPFDDLPRTIRDAIIATRKLDFQYLWVDSLCIVQDSASDWTTEAASMGDIYKNCVLTIAATGASNNEEGLFAERDPLTFLPCRMLKEAADTDLFVCPNKYDFTPTWFYKAPLHERAWVLQERLLSPRTANFGASVMWECRESWQNECGFTQDFDSIGNLGVQISNNKAEKGRFNYFSNPGTLSALEHNQLNTVLLEIWRFDVLLLYTEMKLSVATDRLFAISGIIDDIRKGTGWKNVWGLWEPFLPSELLWQTFSHDLRPRVANRAPSWSWASISTTVFHPVDWREPCTFIATIEGTKEITYTSSIGRHQRTGLRIKSIAFPLKDISFDPMKSQALRVFDSPPAKPTTFKPDTIEIPPGPYQFLPIVGAAKCKLMDDEMLTPYYGIALARSRNVADAYERVGFVEHVLRLGHRIDEERQDYTTFVVV